MKAWLSICSLLTVAAIGFVDYATGPEIALSLLYLLPIAVTAWTAGARGGMAMAVCASVAWLVAEVNTREYSLSLIAYWNGLVAFTVFALVAFLFSQVRMLNEAMKQRVLEKCDALAVERDRLETTQDALAQSEHQFRMLVEGIQDGAVFLLDRSGKIVSWNLGAQGLTGYAPSEAIGKSFDCLWPPDPAVRGFAHEAFQRALSDGAWNGEGWCVRRDGSRFWAARILSVLRDAEGRVRGVSEMLHDATARKHLEDSVLANEDAERQRIGRELHDVVGQDLTAVALLSKELEERLSSREGHDGPLAVRITHAARQALDHARRLCAGLCASRVEADGLPAALQQLALDTERMFAIRCQFQHGVIEVPRRPLVDLHLYRIAQEAVTNAVRHGQARDVQIHLGQVDGQLALRIADNGVGLPDGSLGEGSDVSGLGISIMRHRARTIGGHVKLERAAPSGTVVLCTVPVEEGPRDWQSSPVRKPTEDRR